MTQFNPLRGPVDLPRFGPLAQSARPELHEIMVLRSRAGRLLGLPRGGSPTLGQRLVGGFTIAYYVRTGAQTQTFTARLPTADVGVDLACEVDVELVVGDHTRLVREWTGDLGEQLGNWCRAQAAGITTQHVIRIGGNTGKDLAEVERLVTDRLRTSAQRPSMPGLDLRELRVRLRFANEEIVGRAADKALGEKLKAKRIAELKEMYEQVFGPELAQVISLVGGDQERIVEVAQRMQAEQQLNGQRRIDLFRELISSPAIEMHVRERLASELGRQLGAGDEEVANLAKEMLARPAITSPADDED